MIASRFDRAVSEEALLQKSNWASSVACAARGFPPAKAAKIRREARCYCKGPAVVTDSHDAATGCSGSMVQRRRLIRNTDAELRCTHRPHVLARLVRRVSRRRQVQRHSPLSRCDVQAGGASRGALRKRDECKVVVERQRRDGALLHILPQHARLRGLEHRAQPDLSCAKAGSMVSAKS